MDCRSGGPSGRPPLSRPLTRRRWRPTAVAVRGRRLAAATAGAAGSVRADDEVRPPTDEDHLANQHAEVEQDAALAAVVVHSSKQSLVALAPFVALTPLRQRHSDALSGETAQLGLRVHFHEFVNVVLAAVAGLGTVTTPSSSSRPQTESCDHSFRALLDPVISEVP